MYSECVLQVGIIEVSGAGKPTRPARPFPPLLRGGVYALAWAEGWDLYACGGGELALFQGNKTDEREALYTVCF